MGLFVKNNYIQLFILPLLIWAFSSCSSSENAVEILEETQQFEEENTKVSNGWVQIGNQKFEMAFTCYKTKLGEVAAIGHGEDFETKESAEVLIQAFTGKPYVGLLKNGSTIFEASLNEPLDLSVNDFEITAGAISWQKNLDLETKYGEFAGFGSLFIDCKQFENDLLEEKFSN
tara:strand:+ start:13520 stop:14041 length:522 start_codon:yes stop_codon:yes gene_type:complete